MGQLECRQKESHTPERACAEARGAIAALVDAARRSKEFGNREQGAILLLEEAADQLKGDSYQVCRKLLEAIHAAHRRLGAPGRFGYDFPEGAAMQWLYASTACLAAVIREEEKEAADVT